jgi:hypothetical protein
LTDVSDLLAAADELTDPRRHVEVHACVVCPQMRQDQEEPRVYARAQVCERCRLSLAEMLDSIPHLYDSLPEHLERGTGTWERVTGGDVVAALPFVEDVWDLLLPVRQPLAGTDQIGYLSVKTTMHGWVRDWAETRGKRELGALASVDEHVRWLSDRLDWACDLHPAVDEFAAELRALTRAMRRYIGPDTARPRPCTGVPCRRCDFLTLARLADGSGDVECQNPACRTIYRPDEYERWTRLLAAAVERRTA